MELSPPAEMEIRATEEIEIGRDISPPLTPIAFSLYETFLFSHCSCCFSPLPASPRRSPPVLYCSAACSLTDSAVILPQRLPDVSPLLPSDIRAAVCLLNSLPAGTAHSPHRIGGILTNRCRLMADPSISSAIRRAATFVVSVRRSQANCWDVEAALCLVVTNAVEVQDNTGRGLGIAVYDARFSWINHSCSPNACYRFVISSPETALLQEGLSKPKVVPHIMNTEKGDGDVCCISEHWEGHEWRYGPKVMLRSIKNVKKGEEITISYTDLLQPKALRQSDLWSKYRFVCSCERCAASSQASVDSILEGVLASEPEETTYKAEAARMMTDQIEEAMDDFLSNNIDPETCCEKIESVLNHGIQIKHSRFWLHPMNHIALNANITLASAYKIRSTDPITVDSESDMKSFDMSRISTAYSLFLAGTTHHLFTLEPSLLVSAANFWANAGESLLALARDARWGLPGITVFKCTRCSSMDILQARHRDLKYYSTDLLKCISNILQDTWSFLTHGYPYLQKFRNPVCLGALVGEWSSGDSNGNITEEPWEDKRVSIVNLGVHWLAYAALLAELCYGHDSHLLSHIHTVLARH